MSSENNGLFTYGLEKTGTDFLIEEKLAEIADGYIITESMKTKEKLKLFKKYDEEESAMFLLPLSALYYKLGDFKKSFDYLKKLNQVNRDTFDFFSYVAEGDMDGLISNLSPYGYRADSIEELTQAMSENIHFYSPMMPYFD